MGKDHKMEVALASGFKPTAAFTDPSWSRQHAMPLGARTPGLSLQMTLLDLLFEIAVLACSSVKWK